MPELVADLCDELSLVYATDPFVLEPQTDPVYLRLHGSPPGDRRYYHTYTDEDLDRIAEWVADADRAWVLFNNKSMFEDARRFRERVGGDPDRGRIRPP